MLVAGGTDRCSVDLLGRDASGLQLQCVGGEQVHGPVLRTMGNEELLPEGELVLKRSNGAYVERVATGADGWPQHGMHLRWGGGKTLFDRLKGMLDHTVVGTHTAGMHERNDRGVEGIEHDGQTVSDQQAQRHPWQIGHQRIRGNARQTVLQYGSIDDAHLVAMHLAYSTESRLLQA